MSTTTTTTTTTRDRGNRYGPMEWAQLVYGREVLWWRNTASWRISGRPAADPPELSAIVMTSMHAVSQVEIIVQVVRIVTRWRRLA